MFEKFTESAIKIINLAQEEAKRLEFDSINPEHILLGIIGEEHGSGSKILLKLGLDLKTARILIERLVGRGYMSLPLDEISLSFAVTNLITRSIEIAKNNNYKTVDSEHLLMALLELEDNKQISLIKREFGLSMDKIKEEYIKMLQNIQTDLKENNNKLPEHFSLRYITPLVNNVIESAKEETIKEGHIMVGTEQILWSLSMEQNSPASMILEKYGLTPIVILIEIYRLIGSGSGITSDLIGYNYILQKALKFAWQEARLCPYAKIGTGHLLLGILHVPESTASYIVQHLNKDSEQMCWDIAEIFKNHPNEAEPCIKDLEQELANQAFRTKIQDEVDIKELDKINSE